MMKMKKRWKEEDEEKYFFSRFFVLVFLRILFLVLIPLHISLIGFGSSLCSSSANLPRQHRLPRQTLPHHPLFITCAIL